MKWKNGYPMVIHGVNVVIAVLTFAAASTEAATLVVKFGGSAGNKYVPATLAAATGDTIRWEGSFTVHPLSSTSIPAGAASWHSATGTSFSYVVAVSGTYNYKCDVHPGMTGTFTAGSTGIVPKPGEHGGFAVIATSASGYVRVSVPHGGLVTVNVLTLDGRKFAATSVRAGTGGVYALPLDDIPSYGIYRIEAAFDGRRTIWPYSRNR
jgi:plastocyanin